MAIQYLAICTVLTAYDVEPGQPTMRAMARRFLAFRRR
jgi:hypothetical protein